MYDNQDLIFRIGQVFAGKKVAQQGQAGESGPSRYRLGLGTLGQSAEDAYFAFLQPNVMVNPSLADDWLLHASNVHLPVKRGDFHSQFHADGVVRMHVRDKVNVYAHVNVLKLSIDAHNARGCLKRTG